MKTHFLFGLMAVGQFLLTASLSAQQAVLYTGSDWCDSGVALQKIWESPEFVKQAGMALAIVDEPEVVTEAVRAKWKEQEKIRFELENYPGLAIFDAEGRCVSLDQGLSWDLTAEDLLQRLAHGRERIQQVKTLLEKEGVEGAEAAIKLVLHDLGLERTKRPNGLKTAWDILEQRDPKDEHGIRAALNFKPIETIYKVHEFAKKKDFKGGEEYIKNLLSPAAEKRLTMDQRQGLMLHTFVLYQHEETHKAANLELLQRVALKDQETHFGQGARGMLKMLGVEEAVTNCRPEPLPLKPRVGLQKKPRIVRLKKTAKTPVYAYAASVLSQDTITEICSRKGGPEFLKAFLSDREWAEDFFGSGPAKPSWDACFLMLEEIAWQVPLKDRGLKKWATALALNAGEGSREEVLCLMKAFFYIRTRELLVRGVEKLPVGMMRYVLTPKQISAEEMLWLANTHNVPPRRYSGVCWYAPYRTYNFFGDTIQGPKYYVPWDHVYNRREASRKVGGVCGSLSYYGSLAAKAHGLPSTPGGQPAHCAYSLFVPSENYWWLCYNVNPYTGAHFQMWHYSFDYLPLAADCFFAPGRRKALRAFWRAEVERMAAEPQPSRSAMTCQIYSDWKGKRLPTANQMPKLARTDTNVQQFDVNQGGEKLKDHVVLAWTGTFKMNRAGKVTFALSSDDGSEFILNGEKVIDNDGCHGMIRKEATVDLAAGTHPFSVRYFNYDGGRGLTFDAKAKYPYNEAVCTAYAQALIHAPASYDILLAWEQLLLQAEDTPVEAWERFAEAVAGGLSAHPRPAWDLLLKNALPAIEKARGKDALATWMARLNEIIRQDDRPVAEFCDFAAVLNRQAECLETDEQRFTLFQGALKGQVGTKDAFGIVMKWGGARFLKDPVQTERYVAIVREVLRQRGDGIDMSKFIVGAIREASVANNLTAFHGLNDLYDALSKRPERDDLDLSFAKAPLLSDKGLLRISTTSNWDQPANYRTVIDGKRAVGNFHTASESAPWAEVELPGMAEISAVYLENIHTQNNGRAVPFKVEISEEGTAWQTVATATKSQEDWKLTFAPVKGRFVRVTWTGTEGRTFLHFRKFTVHGKKLY